MANKGQLREDAEALGVEDAEDMTKAQLEAAIAARTPTELGPVIPEGESA
jgi:hypothetical protein